MILIVIASPDLIGTPRNDTLIMSKIIHYKDLPKIIQQLKLNGQRIILAGGCFDILHLGHVRFLKTAKEYGILIIALESDENVRKLKGVNRPIHKQTERAEILAANNYVDYVILLPPLSTNKEYEKLTKTVSPEIIAVTQGDPHIIYKQGQAKSIGAKIIVIPKIPTPSTSQLAKLLKLE